MAYSGRQANTVRGKIVGRLMLLEQPLLGRKNIWYDACFRLPESSRFLSIADVKPYCLKVPPMVFLAVNRTSRNSCY